VSRIYQIPSDSQMMDEVGRNAEKIVVDSEEAKSSKAALIWYPECCQGHAIDGPNDILNALYPSLD